ncbi:MAG: acetate--CoA ligase [Rhodanobacteraceae bacterium]|nr:MAG: acetate--CoA ligase [Rhodanobacteraceae bacterium]
MTTAHPVPPAFAAAAQIQPDDYQRLYAESIAHPDRFWGEAAKRLAWIKPPTEVRDVSFDPADLHIRWYADGILNPTVSCLDRHLATRGDKTALLFEGDDPADSRAISYRQLHAQVCRFANALKHLGVQKGDRVAIYMPMVPETAVAMLACARLGAIHSVVFGGFSPDALAGRIADSRCKLVITADEGVRAGRKIPLKANTDEALARPGTTSVETVIVLRRTGGQVPMQSPRDRWWHVLMDGQSPECPPEPMHAEDPLFILYTSGSTGKPKGVLHTIGGYLVWVSYTHEAIFDLREDDVYWCTADVGWVTGHSYIVYGPLANGATSLLFEGVPTWPDAARMWQVCDKHQVTILYTAPTAIRALMRHGSEPVARTSRTSLRLLGSVGEPINPEAWEWYFNVVGEGRCPIVDTWWQTETGGSMICPLPGATVLKPGAAMKPFFGVRPRIMDPSGEPIEGAGSGSLVIADAWPGMMRTVYGDHQRFIDTYFTQFPGNYCSGDGAERDADGDWKITGRIDDVINVAGHRIGTAEVESAFMADARVAEAAVVGCPDAIKGTVMYAFVTPKAGVTPSPALERELIASVRHQIGAFAAPEYIQWATALPKTRSAKTMRRILRKIAEAGKNEVDLETLGDTSTLADPSVVKRLYVERIPH